MTDKEDKIEYMKYRINCIKDGMAAVTLNRFLREKEELKNKTTL